MALLDLPLRGLNGARSLSVPVPAVARRHARSLIMGGGLLVLIAVVHGLNMAGWPGRVNDDEGTYVAQAWAVLYRGDLAHYTYTYDHPPIGWLTIAAYATLTGAFLRNEVSLMVGRELMLLTSLVSSGLLFMFARRIGLRRPVALAAVALFALTPLALQYHRMVFLDNLAMAWTLGALVFAASPRRSLAAAVGAGLCFGMAVLTKETAALFLPVLVWTMVQYTDRRTRHWNLTITACTAFGIGFFYPLYAILKKELFAGPGHVSLLDMIVWQLHSREGTGSLTDPTSATSALVRSWLELDPWLLLAGLALIPLAVTAKNLRPVVLALVLQVVIMLRGGYLPYPFVIGLLPFAALIVAGAAQHLWALAPRVPTGWWPARQGAHLVRLGLRGLLVAACVSVVVLAAPRWWTGAERAMTVDVNGPSRAGTAWIVANIDKEAVIIVDDHVWPDLAQQGFRNQIWSYKADLDPAVKASLLPDGWASADYVALSRDADSVLSDLPTVAAAIENSTVVASFGDGDLVVRKVIKPTTG